MKHKRLLKITVTVVLSLLLLLFVADFFLDYDALSQFIQNEIVIFIAMLVAIIQLVLWIIASAWWIIAITKQKSSHQPKLKPLDQLREKVEFYWVKGFLEESTHHAALMALGKELQPNQVMPPFIPPSNRVVSTPELENRELPPDETIQQVFQTEANRALLILGEPGSGKSTTLVELAKALLEVKNNHPPVPVVFNLASWADKQTPLVDWMVSELRTQYSIPQHISEAWFAEADKILPLLDGLDEVREDAREACVEAINELIGDSGLTGVAVCCRTAEYKSLGSRLKLNAAIRLQPLQSTQVFKYLEAGGEPLATLKQLLQQDKDMLTLAETPLMLYIMSLAYQNSTDILADYSTLAEKRQALFDRYIETMFTHRATDKKVYSKEKTVHYLSWLANRLQTKGETLFLVENLQPDWSASPWGYRLLYGLFWGMFTGVLLDFMGSPLYYSVIIGVVLFFIQLFTGGDIETMETLGWSWKKFRQDALKKALYQGLLFGLLVGLLLGLLLGLLFGLLFGLLLGLLFGLLYGLLEAGLENQIPDNKNKVVVNQGIVASWKNSLRFGIPFGTLAGIVVWIGMTTAGFIEVSWFNFVFYLFLGIIVGFFWLGGIAITQHYTLRLLLFLEGYTPFNYVRFLDESAKLIFLKKVGGTYVFIHRMFLNHLAEKWSKSQ
ncbi:NACHT domain-containing protein [Candidatus Parabeggiatoa sp. HSG14]|uniref:NACHT domain-containing protein n=1 Tax=Candidatus Parabeggiatoa sp. HSG14 TaxID=3055593 RepID=UPI0025A8AA3C|nr:NACHT domain-containing protein [Thiotrichales bacterium HSG14]